MAVPILVLLRRQVECAGHADREGHGFGARAPALLLMTAACQWPKPCAAADQQGPDTFGSMKLVRAVAGEGDERRAAAATVFKRVGHRRVFNGAGEDGPGFLRRESEQGEVFGLGGAAGEDDFVSIGPQDSGQTFSRVFQGSAGAAANR